MDRSIDRWIDRSIIDGWMDASIDPVIRPYIRSHRSERFFEELKRATGKIKLSSLNLFCFVSTFVGPGSLKPGDRLVCPVLPF